MTNREFIATGSKEKVSNMMCEMLAHGGLCKKYCKGCAEAKWDCKKATEKMLDAEVEKCYLN